jgi:hypothetical protein
MFNPNKTVFILGAGASWHYGYPTGEELVKKVIAKARTAAAHFSLVLNNADSGALTIRPNYIPGIRPTQFRRTD